MLCNRLSEKIMLVPQVRSNATIVAADRAAPQSAVTVARARAIAASSAEENTARCALVV
jgi:hypothetical protein